MTSQHGVTAAAVIAYFARNLQRSQLDEVAFGDDRFVAVPRAHLLTTAGAKCRPAHPSLGLLLFAQEK